MDDDHFRIGDNDRRRALESLTSLAASGHLTVDEFDERSAAAAIARTRGDIKTLFDDIPGVDFTASDDSADASEEAAKPVSLESPDAYDYTMLPDATQNRASGFQIRVGIMCITAIFGITATAITANPLFIVVLNPIVAILLFVLKVGPARWYVPSAGELERRQLKRLRHQKNLQQELEGDANP